MKRLALPAPEALQVRMVIESGPVTRTIRGVVEAEPLSLLVPGSRGRSARSAALCGGTTRELREAGDVPLRLAG